LNPRRAIDNLPGMNAAIERQEERRVAWVSWRVHFQHFLDDLANCIRILWQNSVGWDYCPQYDFYRIIS